MSEIRELPEKDSLSIIGSMRTLNIDVLIGKNVRRLREGHGLSQAQLAIMIGTTPQRLSRLAQFGAGILLLYGFREFFLADILSELKILSVRASSRERYSPDSSSDETK